LQAHEEVEEIWVAVSNASFPPFLRSVFGYFFLKDAIFLGELNLRTFTEKFSDDLVDPDAV